MVLICGVRLNCKCPHLRMDAIRWHVGLLETTWFLHDYSRSQQFKFSVWSLSNDSFKIVIATCSPSPWEKAWVALRLEGGKYFFKQTLISFCVEIITCELFLWYWWGWVVPLNRCPGTSLHISECRYPYSIHCNTCTAKLRILKHALTGIV